MLEPARRFLPVVAVLGVCVLILSGGCPGPRPPARPASPLADPLPVTLFGATAQANETVYVIDRSGSMLDTFDNVRAGLLQSLDRLEASQQFHLMFFGAGAPLAYPLDEPAHATDENKRQAAQFLNTIRPEGQTNPLPALNLAFDVLDKADARQAKVMFILTDGVLPDNDKVLSLIKARNKGRAVRICTVLIGSRDVSARLLLERVAKENGGRFIAVKDD